MAFIDADRSPVVVPTKAPTKAPPPAPASTPAPTPAKTGSGRLPVASGVVTQVYGPTSEPLDSGGFNKGLDIGAPVGTPVSTVVGGTVIQAGWGNDGWGISVKIRDADGNVHNYGHLSGVNVSVGQTIGQGVVLGAVGNTGASTGPHLSYDVQAPNGQYVDPSRWLGFNAAGDNRSGHPILGRDIAELGSFAGGGSVASTEWEQKYASVYGQWAPLDDKYRMVIDLGSNAMFVSGQGWVAGAQFDALDQMIPGSGTVIMTDAEYQQYSTLSRQLEELEDEWEATGGGDSLDDAITRATFAYETDPRVIDAQNAANRFAREMDIRSEAAGMANTRLRESRAHQATAIEQTNAARAAPMVGQIASAPRKELPSAEDIFRQSVADVREGLPDVPDMPYFPQVSLPGSGQKPSLAVIRRRAASAAPPPMPEEIAKSANDPGDAFSGRSFRQPRKSSNTLAASPTPPPVIPTVSRTSGVTDGGQAFEGRAVATTSTRTTSPQTSQPMPVPAPTAGPMGVINGSILYGRK